MGKDLYMYFYVTAEIRRLGNEAVMLGLTSANLKYLL